MAYMQTLAGITIIWQGTESDLVPEQAMAVHYDQMSDDEKVIYVEQSDTTLLLNEDGARALIKELRKILSY